MSKKIDSFIFYHFSFRIEELTEWARGQAAHLLDD